MIFFVLNRLVANLGRANACTHRLLKAEFYTRRQITSFVSFETEREKWQRKFCFDETLHHFERIRPDLIKENVIKFALRKLTWLSQNEHHLDFLIGFCKK